MIKPLLENPGKTTNDVLKRANLAQVSRKTIYEWITKYQQGGLEALKSKKNLRGRKPAKFPIEVEELLREFIDKNGKYSIFKKQCLQKGYNSLEFPTEDTFLYRKRITRRKM
ncbi:MAG: hypothetical protein DRP87_09625 [Spirochaetes bacterium]|nr:MAG: hypothetical protein DRP87_09625 [Spirochaetota bacterium]